MEINKQQRHEGEKTQITEQTKTDGECREGIANRGSLQMEDTTGILTSPRKQKYKRKHDGAEGAKTQQRDTRST
jgi:hypothetical protein